MQFRHVLRVLGLFLLIFSITLVPPWLLALWANDGQQLPFLSAFLLIFGMGLALWLPVRRCKGNLRTRDGFIIATAFWVLVALAGALPLMLATAPHMGFTDAMFESMSGLTTTGATVLTGIDDLPLSIRYYRQQLNWLGGMGIVVLVVAILPALGVGGMQLYRAEMPGPIKDAKLTPRIADTAKSLWYIYVGLTVLCALAYWWGGMSLFDAICHSFSTISTGGFSTHDASMGHFQSPVLENLGAFFMVLSGVNFALHFMVWHGRTLRPYGMDEENLFYLGLVGVAVCLIALLLFFSGPMSMSHALRLAFFQVATFITNTGLSSSDYYNWPVAAQVLLLFISIVGGCAGSTAGGIKVMRFMLLLKQGSREVQLLIHPQAVIPIKLGNRTVDARVTSAVWAFFAVYIAVFALLMLILAATGMNQETAFSAVVGTINNLGLGMGEVSSGFSQVSDTGKWTLVISMLLGRLEIFTVLVLFSPRFWRS